MHREDKQVCSRLEEGSFRELGERLGALHAQVLTSVDLGTTSNAAERRRQSVAAVHGSGLGVVRLAPYSKILLGTPCLGLAWACCESALFVPSSEGLPSC